jgi:hypothetical protein
MAVRIKTAGLLEGHSGSPETQRYIRRLEAYIVNLRTELMEQWEANHHEHCSEKLEHGGRCHWPKPSLLADEWPL